MICHSQKDVPRELMDAVERYEDALMRNATDILAELFADDPSELPVTRADNAGLLNGHQQITEYRAQRGTAPSRVLRSRSYRMLANCAATVVATFDKDSGGVVTQTQVWQLIDGSWKIVSAHLTYPVLAMDSRIWRVVGSPLKQGARTESSTDLPLRGLSVAVKDLYGVEGYAIGAGSEAFLAEGIPQQHNSWPVQRLLDAGADVLGISRTDEFAYSLAGTNAHYGTPPNPQAPGRISGGSSSGSASATALGQVDIGLGSDTGGSVRVPSSYQHLWGIRTTCGSVPMEGVLPLSQSFDTVGWMTRTPDLLEKVAKVLITQESGVESALSGKVIWSEELMSSTNIDVSAGLHAWISRLEESARNATDVSLEQIRLDGILGPRFEGEGPDRLSDWLSSYKIVQGYEAWRNHGTWLARHWNTLGADIESRFRTASELTAENYRNAREHMDFWKTNVRSILGQSVLLVPSASSVAPKITDSAIGGTSIEDERTATMRLTCIAGLTGLPAVNIPIRTEDGLPCGICAVGPAGSDTELIAFARRLSELAA